MICLNYYLGVSVKLLVTELNPNSYVSLSSHTSHSDVWDIKMSLKDFNLTTSLVNVIRK